MLRKTLTLSTHCSARRAPVQARCMATGLQHAVKAVRDAVGWPLPEAVMRKPREEGTIASVFASLSGEGAKDLPPRFAELKRRIINTPELATALKASFDDLCFHLQQTNREIVAAKTHIIPELEYRDIHANEVDPSLVEDVKKRGVAVIRGVVSEEQALEWLEDIKTYIAKNPQVAGFPVNDKQVFEMYWSKSQLEARSHPASLQVQSYLLSLFRSAFSSSSTTTTSTSNPISSTPLTYCDRLRIRHPGDSQFALGPHVDGGSIERWEDEAYRSTYQRILRGKWRDYDAWDVAGRQEANMNMYDGPGACGVFRALQGWTSLSTTSKNEGTLQVYPAIQESSAYMMMRPFFKPIQPSKSLPASSYLHPSNWDLDLDTSTFPNAPLGRSQEFNDDTHPHLELGNTMTSLKQVRPGDQAFWHCDGIHAVESHHHGSNASSVLYIPSVPLTLPNIDYIRQQRESFLAGIPPPDFPGGDGERTFVGRATEEAILSKTGRQAMGLESFDIDGDIPESERELRMKANELLGLTRD